MYTGFRVCCWHEILFRLHKIAFFGIFFLGIFSPVKIHLIRKKEKCLHSVVIFVQFNFIFQSTAAINKYGVAGTHPGHDNFLLNSSQPMVCLLSLILHSAIITQEFFVSFFFVVRGHLPFPDVRSSPCNLTFPFFIAHCHRLNREKERDEKKTWLFRCTLCCLLSAWSTAVLCAAGAEES